MNKADNRKDPGFRVFFKQATGIEPASSAWEADILPMYYACKRSNYFILGILCYNFKSMKKYFAEVKGYDRKD